MLQLPVGNLEKIRKSRKRVKDVLCDVGFENCKDLLNELQRFDVGDEAFDNTDWFDFTEGYHGKRRKKWRYRTRGLCCTLCRFSARSWNGYRSHMRRYHEEEQDIGALSICSCCSFVAHPKVVIEHFRIFHPDSMKSPSAPIPPTGVTTTKGLPVMVDTTVTGDRYSCRRCGYQDSLIYCIKKHVFVNHYSNLMNRYFGQRTDTEMKITNGARTSKFYCKVCSVPAESSDHLIYHILTSEKHKELEVHIKALIYEHSKFGKKYLQQKLPSLAPKVTQQNVYNVPLVHGASATQLGGTVARPPFSGTVLRGTPSNTTTVVCTPATGQAFLPGQTSTVVRLANVEAQSLLRTGQAVAALKNAPLPKGIPAGGVATTLVRAPVGTLLPTVSQNGPKPMPITVGVPTQTQQPRQVLLPPGVQVSVQGKLALRGPGPQPLLVTQRLPVTQSTSRGTVLTTQSLFSHLIPTGNKVNGLPTYTLAPVQVTVPVQSSSAQGTGKGPVTVVQGSTTTITPQQNKPLTGAAPSTTILSSTTVSKQTQKWVSCPVCKELFPADVHKVHMETAHGQVPVMKKAKVHGLAARAPFLKKVNSKILRCLTCNISLSGKGLFEHLLHGLKCLHCPGMFYSIKQLLDHTAKEHSTSQLANRNFMKQEYQLHINDHGDLLVPHFDINTTAPKELLGDKELNLALVTVSLDLIYVKLLPGSAQPVCRTPIKSVRADCPFCPEKPQTVEDYELHLKTKHHIVPTIHAILKSPAFKCAYCSGVYTGKTTPQAISTHVQRCRCAPKTAKDVERLINPDSKRQVVAVNGGVSHPATSKVVTLVPASKTSDTEAQIQSRFEAAMKAALEANKQERDARAAKRSQFRNFQDSVVGSEGTSETSVSLLLDTTGKEMLSFDERKKFLTDYFNKKPYLTKMEMETLAARLWFNKTDVACHFGTRRSKCMRAIQKRKTVVLLGFNMTELKKVKHNIQIPVKEKEKPAERPCV
ncbi:activity-dependent neuroprotective protein 2a-like [Anguilla rostrata]|uniref:activity-dependent neuroprotective protein 2a-like n=1 Tax=Anguilla rostrata TaxID=7938 RepID=UPI0030D1CB52